MKLVHYMVILFLNNKSKSHKYTTQISHNNKYIIQKHRIEVIT